MTINPNNIAVISNSALFTAAHKLAKANRANFASYREAFAAALREGYKAVRKMQQIVADKFASIVRLPAIKMRRNVCTVAQRLLDLGCKIWKGQRIYANFHAAKIFANYDNFGRGRKAELMNAYFDLSDNTWHNNWIGTLNEQFAA